MTLRIRLGRRLRHIVSKLQSEPITVKSSMLSGEFDLGSLGGANAEHLIEYVRGNNKKSHFTTDTETLEIAESIIKESSNPEFFRKLILTEPSTKTNEKGSIKVKISNITDFKQIHDLYKSKKAETTKDTIACVGGPAAEDQILLTNLVPAIKAKLHETIYTTRDYSESNVWHSAKQSHARHANALNADDKLTGHSLLPKIIMRKILGVDLEDVLKPDFRKIDVDFTIDPKKLRIYFGNELNWLKQKFIKHQGKLNEHDINRIEARLAQDIKDAFQKTLPFQISGRNSKSDLSSAIHVNFTEEETKELKHEHELFETAGIESEELTRKEIDFFFNNSEEIHSAFKYPGDTYIKFDDHAQIKKLAQENGTTWIEGEEISRIFLIKNEQGNAKMAGLLTKNNDFIYANKLHFTGGYKVEYEYDKSSPSRMNTKSLARNFLNQFYDALDVQKPLNSEITTATGVSINAIFRKSDKIKKIIEKYGSTGEIAITNSHWTMVLDNKDFVIIRITGGGNTGSESYNPTYYLNTIANTRRIFGDDLVGIISTFGCPRAVNAKNTTEFTKLAEGAVISHGKGGTGNTKRQSEAALATMMLGFSDEIIEHFNGFLSRNDLPLGDEIKQIYEHLQETELFHDNLDKTNRRMGYDETLSLSEALVLCAILASVSITYSLSQKQDKKPTQFKSTSAIALKQKEVKNER